MALLGAFLAACGDGERLSERQAVANTVRAYLDAVADRDGARACRLLTLEAQVGVFQARQAHVGPDHAEEGCARVIDTYAPIFGVKPLRRARVSMIRVQGGQAHARAGTFPIRLEKLDGAWKLAVSGVATSLGDRPPLRVRQTKLLPPVAPPARL